MNEYQKQKEKVFIPLIAILNLSERGSIEKSLS